MASHGLDISNLNRQQLLKLERDCREFRESKDNKYIEIREMCEKLAHKLPHLEITVSAVVTGSPNNYGAALHIEKDWRKFGEVQEYLERFNIKVDELLNEIVNNDEFKESLDNQQIKDIRRDIVQIHWSKFMKPMYTL